MSKVINLGMVFVEAGMEAKTAKSQATRLYNKAGVEAKNGLVSVEDFMAVTATYEDENNTSKYAVPMRELRKVVAGGTVKPEWVVETIAAPKTDAFINNKVLKVVEDYATQKGMTDILNLIKGATEKLIAEKEAKK